MQRKKNFIGIDFSKASFDAALYKGIAKCVRRG